MFDSPSWWTPQELTKEEMTEICQWLGRWQKAYVSAEAVMEETPQLDPAIRKGMTYVQALLRHINAIDKRIQERIATSHNADEINFLTSILVVPDEPKEN